jgi:hypothetical protein
MCAAERQVCSSRSEEERVERDLAPRLARYDEWVATIEVMKDAELVADLKRADAESDEDARPYSEIRRELGLA